MTKAGMKDAEAKDIETKVAEVENAETAETPPETEKTPAQEKRVNAKLNAYEIALERVRRFVELTALPGWQEIFQTALNMRERSKESLIDCESKDVKFLQAHVQAPDKWFEFIHRVCDALNKFSSPGELPLFSQTPAIARFCMETGRVILEDGQELPPEVQDLVKSGAQSDEGATGDSDAKPEKQKAA